jgi:DNA-directed RNA polymerase specialized sigma24 family protein
VNDDAELLERIRNGAPDDFAEVVRRHQSRVFAILHRYERDAHRVEDLAQETFVKAWRALEQFAGRAPFEHWLSRIAVRVALDHLRREKKRRNEIGLPELGGVIAHPETVPPASSATWRSGSGSTAVSGRGCMKSCRARTNR